MSGLLRICTAGSVDDGKSTLIGRLLYDSQSVYEDQVHSVEKASKNRNAGPIDFSLFTDGLRAEREQGITIDVAYRYFATARRKFILADTPGHEQYTRNMATGASTADVAILLVDARHGVRVQSRRTPHRAPARHPGFRARDQQDGPRRVRPRRVENIREDFEEDSQRRAHACHPVSA
jgi:sulfate adenylyltransferase subunit 1 (EFTu-like GTPase family)